LTAFPVRDVLRYSAATESELAGRVTGALIEMCRIGPRSIVLDVACGGGNPSVRIAARHVPHGAVFAVDDSGSAIADFPFVTDAAGRRNLFVSRAGAEHLPFTDAAFDAATCRFGLMFFADAGEALTELRRVLRPGARAAFAVFGRRGENGLYIAIEAAFSDVGETAAHCSERIFRFSGDGGLEAALRGRGFENIETRSVNAAFDGRIPTVLLRHILHTTYGTKLAGLPAEVRNGFARCLRERLGQRVAARAVFASYRLVAGDACAALRAKVVEPTQ